MKILLIHSHYQLQGGEDSVVEQEMELLKQDHTVEVLYFQNQAGLKGALQFLCSIWNIGSATAVRKKIQEFKPDIVHVHNWHFAMGPLVFREIYRLRIPIVHTVHNYRLLCPSAILLYKGQLFTDSLKQAFPWKAILNKVYRSSIAQTFWLAFVVWFHKKIGTWQKIDAYVCLTPFAVELFQQSNFRVSKEHFTVKPNFRIAPVVDSKIEKESHFLFIGRLSEEKGIDVLLDAFKELPYLIKIAGEGPLKELVEEGSKQFSNISYLGNLSSEKVVAELQKTQALIFPSVWYEGMPMTIIEAFSVGTPIIASNLGAMSSMISNEQNGFHFESSNVNDLKQTITKFNMLSDSVKEEMGSNAFKSYTEKYSPELQQQYFDAIYSAVLIRE
ncbi:glycosyltransferase family 4 protein [Flavobacterium sp. XN-5]|uniref:glycosyltransferase n=1 Tax=Flavobacterium sp. XN-5 TaxID=2599390 RepID=UPI0011C7C39F|nr:glycosyltransferase [Flavobacterium sp. XN-5]NGY37406.1 glycosyltransferase family 4 protein [Flavobacterium sp. XN-5]